MGQLTWLITGCSSGLGKALAMEALHRGDQVIATARDITKLTELESKGAKALELDITSGRENLNEIVQQALGIYGHIEVLVNNAGYVQAGALEEISFTASIRNERLRPNPSKHAILPHFRQRRTGVNVFIGSLSGFVADKFAGPYSGSKFALEGLVESLEQETREFGIQTLLIQPGRFRTRLLSPESRRDQDSMNEDYIASTEEFFDLIDQVDGYQAGDVNKAASVIIDLIREEGVAEGRTIPFRFQLGTDCYDESREKAEGMLRIMDEWKNVMISTNHI